MPGAVFLRYFGGEKTETQQQSIVLNATSTRGLPFFSGQNASREL